MTKRPPTDDSIVVEMHDPLGLGYDAEPDDAVPDDNFGGDTKAHYTPVTPRQPALDRAEQAFADTHGFFALSPQLIRAEMLTHATDKCVVCAIVQRERDIQAAGAAEPAPSTRTSIAEQFQDILWQAYYAGATGKDPSREAFVRWYERTVLR